MAKAAGACRYAEVCYASRDALTVAGPCRRGDVLALVEGEVHLIGTDLAETCRGLLDRLLGGGGELVTLVTGADAPAGLVDGLRAHAAAHWPFVEVHTYTGGHPHYPLLVGVE
jgi:dihydroxyacetone kinase-like predicted kinase